MKRFIIFIIAILVALPTFAQRMFEYTDPATSDVYLAFSADGISPKFKEKRSENPNFRVSLPLHYYSTTGVNNPVLDLAGDTVRVMRHKKETAFSYGDVKLSNQFIISPTDVYNDGATAAQKLPDGVTNNRNSMDWATANGYLVSANSVLATVVSSATPMGCPMYRGKSGKDPIGSWRVPTVKEWYLISPFFNEFGRLDKSRTNFVPFAVGSYWTSSMDNSRYNFASYVTITTPSNVEPSSVSIGSSDKVTPRALRCIRDLD